jgi:hypothetical protein
VAKIGFEKLRKNESRTGTCHLDRRQRSEATKEEWRDPEDVRAALLVQGILPE